MIVLTSYCIQHVVFVPLGYLKAHISSMCLCDIIMCFNSPYFIICIMSIMKKRVSCLLDVCSGCYVHVIQVHVCAMVVWCVCVERGEPVHEFQELVA